MASSSKRGNLARSMRRRPLRLEMLENRCLLSAYYVATTGSDADAGTLDQPFATIGHALAAARQAGDQVIVRGGTYNEQLVLPHGGSRRGGYFTLQAYEGETPVLSGAGLPGGDMVLLRNLSYVKIIGFEITDNEGVVDGSGIRILGSGSNIELRNNKIHDMRGQSAMGITVYGTSRTAVSNLVIDGNEIYDCEPADSEALTLNGNVTNFVISNNRVHDVNNIGIDMIGGERDINRTQVVRNGLVRGNVVYHARSNYDGGYAAGIYVDGAKNIVIENNVSYENDVGLEVGAENRGIVTSGIVVRNNLIYHNDKAGIGFGGYERSRGRVQNCSFVNNTVYQNDTLGAGFGQLWIQYSSKNTVANNIFWASANNVLLASDAGNSANVLNNNLWYTDAGADQANFTWNGREFSTFAAYRAATRQDSLSRFGDPGFVNAAAADFHLTAGSPAIDAGSVVARRYAPTDFDGNLRPLGSRPDIGAYEYVEA